MSEAVEGGGEMKEYVTIIAGIPEHGMLLFQKDDHEDVRLPTIEINRDENTVTFATCSFLRNKGNIAIHEFCQVGEVQYGDLLIHCMHVTKMKSVRLDANMESNLVWGIRKMMNLPKDLTLMQNVILALTEHGLTGWKLVFEGGWEFNIEFENS
jgi:hypothetical protein